MWISSSSIKNRVSNRGRIDISRGSISGWKASLLLLALASFSISAASESCEGPKDGTCFAMSKDDLKDGRSDYIGFDKDGNITWDTSKSQPDSKIDLYTRECGKLSFIMSDLAGSEDKCEFSMLYYDCTMAVVWTKTKMGTSLGFSGGNGEAFVGLDSEVKVDLERDILEWASDGSNGHKKGFCPFETKKDGKWCSFKFAFNKKTGSCKGKIQFDKCYKLGFPAPTTAAPETTSTTDATSIAANDHNNANTTPGGDAAGLSPWIIVAIVVGVLILVAKFSRSKEYASYALSVTLEQEEKVGKEEERRSLPPALIPRPVQKQKVLCCEAV